MGDSDTERCTVVAQGHAVGSCKHEDRLRCPFCDKHFKFCSGQVLGTYFRHKPGEGPCLGPGKGGGSTDQAYPPTRTMWIRFKFARLLRHLLPDATVDDKPALSRLDGHMIVTFPNGAECAVEVDCSPRVAFDSFAHRWEEHRLARRPVIWVFAGDQLITRAMRQEPGAITTKLDPLLIAYMEKGAPHRPQAHSFADRGYLAFTSAGSLNRSTEEPHSLVLFLPAEGDEDLGALVGLRGLVPGRKDVWTGTLVRADFPAGRPHPVQFTQRRGLYFLNDVEMVKYCRNRVKEHRRIAAQNSGGVSCSAPTIIPATEPEKFTDMVMAPPGEWIKAMLDHFLEHGKPFRIVEACQWVAQHYSVHPSLTARDPRFLMEMGDFWETVAANGSVRLTDSQPIWVVPLKRN